MKNTAPLPPHIAVSADFFKPKILEILHRGITVCHVVKKRSFPKTPQNPSITEVPYLLICTEGVLTCWIPGADETKVMHVRTGQAVLFYNETWVAVDPTNAGVFRVTFNPYSLHIGLRNHTSTINRGKVPSVGESLYLNEITGSLGVFASGALQRCFEDVSFRQSQSPLLVQLILYDILHMLEERPVQPGKSAGTWSAIALFLQEHFSEHLTRENVAARFEINPAYLHFDEVTGKLKMV